jgi:hypothetical protein
MRHLVVLIIHLIAILAQLLDPELVLEQKGLRNEGMEAA